MEVIEFEEKSFIDAINSGKLVIADFYANWCQPCRLQHPVIEEAAKKYGDKVIFGRVNIEYNPSAARAYDVASIPTLIFLRYGSIKKKRVGFTDLKELSETIDDLLQFEF